ncbi:MarR family winged helix-turn-helix transcriptional regulator [Nocardioides panacisoli]|uniref:MarR family winged helix-turn-helix transcriptional regulator n=1 Tax=Nocardioides panacisoli TaxID=627624 RepID=UPI0031D3DE97
MTHPDRLEQLGSELVVQSARLVRLVRRSLAQPAGVRVLSLLDELGPTGVSALAAADHCSQPTMTGQVRQLKEHGWVQGAPNPDDARGTLVSLTDAGRAELTRVRADHGRMVAERLRRTQEYDDQQVAAAVELLRTVLENPTDDTTDENPGRNPS